MRRLKETDNIEAMLHTHNILVFQLRLYLAICVEDKLHFCLVSLFPINSKLSLALAVIAMFNQ